jgi:hypothetical protein
MRRANGDQRQPRLFPRGRGHPAVGGREQLHQPQIPQDGAAKKEEPLGGRPAGPETAQQLYQRPGTNLIKPFSVCIDPLGPELYTGLRDTQPNDILHNDTQHKNLI